MRDPQARSFARKRMSQNFLIDQSIIANIVDYLDLKSDDHVVEIGPGLGALTALLWPMVARYDGIELDRRCITHLQQRWPNQPTLHWHQGDVLAFDWSSLPSQQPWRLVGNLPYQIASPCLLMATQWCHRLRDACFMIQKEMAERLLSAPGCKAYGRLTVMVGYYFDRLPVVDAPAEAFEPAPKVDSMVCHLVPRERAPEACVRDEVLFAEVVAAAFQKRRKMIRHGLAAWLDEAAWDTLSLDSRLRPEALTIEDYVQITNYIDTQRRSTP